jgi:hypothetical protein
MKEVRLIRILSDNVENCQTTVTIAGQRFKLLDKVDTDAAKNCGRKLIIVRQHERNQVKLKVV